MTEEWRFRPGTLDEAIFNAVVLFNEYRLPPSLAAADIVLDIGAHTGSFARAAASRGCEHVYSVEPDQANVEMASGNLSSYIASGFVRLIRGAVWRSDA